MHVLTLFSALNAFYTFARKRHYRLFEANIDESPSTPSAHRVRVDSTPLTSSPLRYLVNKLTIGSAGTRAHPDTNADVWELAIWDPLAISLRLFCLFSPGHVLVYWLFLPTQLSDPRPSVTVVTMLLVAVLLSLQMSFLTSFFTLQAKDTTLVHKEVLREYDIKFVHPRTRPLMRDVGIQYSESDSSHPGSDAKYNQVEVYKPVVIVSREFRTSPNPNYASHVDPEGLTPRRQTAVFTPATASAAHLRQEPVQTPSQLRDWPGVLRGSGAVIRQPQFRPPSSCAGDGGSLGIYSHANSPLRRPPSTNFERRVQTNADMYYKERATSPMKRPSSPLKRS